VTTLAHIPIEEYLRTIYEPDEDYVDGTVEERNLGEYDHNAAQKVLLFWFARHEKQWGIRVIQEQRIRLSSTRVRIPDVSIFPREFLIEQVFTRPPPTDDTINCRCMQYVHILNLIDAYLDRLKRARQILTAPDTHPKRSLKRTPQSLRSPKTLKTAERENPAAPARQFGKYEISHRKKATSAMLKKKPGMINLTAACFAKAETVVSEPALVLVEQIPHEEHQAQRGRLAEESALGQIVTTLLTAKVPTKRRRSTLSKAPVAPLATALGGVIPDVPIFIPAERVRLERFKRQPASVIERGPFGLNATVPLTVELLTQRWLQNLVS
jgi:hypothetical protein